MKFEPREPRYYMRRRRERRLDRNLSSSAQAKAWADKRGFSLRVNNDGQHWIFQKPGWFVEWWPSSAKLVLNRDYGGDIHAYNLQQVLAVLEKETVSGRPAA